LKSLKYDAFRSWRPNGICANLVHHPPATSSARSATGCVVHGLGFFPATSHARDDETRRIDGSVHDGWRPDMSFFLCCLPCTSLRVFTKFSPVQSLMLSIYTSLRRSSSMFSASQCAVLVTIPCQLNYTCSRPLFYII